MCVSSGVNVFERNGGFELHIHMIYMIYKVKIVSYEYVEMGFFQN